MAADDDHTFLFYKYYNVEWKTTTSFRVQAGYSFNPGLEGAEVSGSGSLHTEIINPSIPAEVGDSLAFHKVLGNTNRTGLYFYTLQDPTVPVNTDACIAWKASQETVITYNQTITAILSDPARFRKVECPCKRRQAARSGAYKRNRLATFPSQYVCFYRRRLLKINELKDTFISTNCCYDRKTNALILTDTDDRVLTRNHFVKSSLSNWQMNRRGQTRREYHTVAIRNDSRAFDDCCLKSDLCDQFRLRRPIPTCQYYKTPLRGNHDIVTNRPTPADFLYRWIS